MFMKPDLVKYSAVLQRTFFDVVVDKRNLKLSFFDTFHHHRFDFKQICVILKYIQWHKCFGYVLHMYMSD